MPSVAAVIPPFYARKLAACTMETLSTIDLPLLEMEEHSNFLCFDVLCQ